MLRQNGENSVEQLEGPYDICENDKGDEEGSTADGLNNDGQEEKLINALRRMGIKAP